MNYSDITKAVLVYSLLIFSCSIIFGFVYLDLINPVQLKLYITGANLPNLARADIQKNLLVISLFALALGVYASFHKAHRFGTLWCSEMRTISLSFIPLLIPGLFLARHFFNQLNWNGIIFNTFEIFFLIIFFGISFGLICSNTFYIKKAFSSRIWFYLLIFFTIVFIGWYGFLSFKRHWAFQSHVLDLGIFAQLAYTGSIGNFFRFTISPDYSNFLGYHFSPTLIVLSLAYLVIPRIETVLAVQTLFLAFAAIPLYLLAFRILQNKFLALAIGIAYLAHPFIAQTVMFDFHEVSLEPLIIFTMFYFLSRKSSFWYWVFFALALLCKEDVGLFLMPVGFFLIFNEKEFKLGSLTVLFSLIYTIIVFKLLMPAFSEVTGYSFNWVFAYLGNSPLDVLKTIALNPLFILKKCSNWLNLRTIFFLFAPLMFTPLWSRWGILLIVAPLFEVWLHESAVASQGSYHHILVVVPFAFVAGIIGLKNLSSKYLQKAKDKGGN
ncbi:DUF2079 domain-containing protein [bacterium]|nr:DUF2079 domain-containing protein [bacterium]